MKPEAYSMTCRSGASDEILSTSTRKCSLVAGCAIVPGQTITGEAGAQDAERKGRKGGAPQPPRPPTADRARQRRALAAFEFTCCHAFVRLLERLDASDG